MILLQTQDLIEEGLKITPGSATAYGALVVILAAAVVALWRKLFTVEKDFREVTNTSVELLTRVSQRLDDQQEQMNMIRELKHDLKNLSLMIQALSTNEK